MNITLKGIALITIGVSAMLMTGCTAIIRPVINESDFLSSEAKITADIKLYITDEFKNYSPEKLTVSDMRKFKFELGAISVDAFRYGLASRFSNVEVKLGQPSFPITGSDGLVIVVNPSFVHFDVAMPLMFKFESYRVVLAYMVDVYDRDGNKIISKRYDGEGKKRGSIGYESAGHEANAVAARLAVEDAIKKVVDDIVIWAKSK